MRWTWQHSSPTAHTDRLPAVPGPRRPRTLRIPRVRKVILRDPIDQTAAEQLEAVLRGAKLIDAAVVIAEAVIGRQLVPDATWQHVVRQAAHALIAVEQRLAATEARASAALSSSSVRCPRCTAAELCAPHQQVLWRWWDVRDAVAVDVINLTVAALAAGPPRPASARPARRRS